MHNRLHDRKVFITNGYGAAFVQGAVAYYYLIGSRMDELEAQSKEFQIGKSQLYKGATDSDRVAFSVIDIDSKRFKENLFHKGETGSRIYSSIQVHDPCIVKSATRLVDVENVSDIQIVRLSHLAQDFQWAVAEMARFKFGDRTALLSILKSIQDNIKIEPAIPIIGVKWNVNALLKRWIDSIKEVDEPNSR